MCKICKFLNTSDEDTKKHIIENHATVDEIDRSSDFEEEYYSSDESKYKFCYKS